MKTDKTADFFKTFFKDKNCIAFRAEGKTVDFTNLKNGQIMKTIFEGEKHNLSSDVELNLEDAIKEILRLVSK